MVDGIALYDSPLSLHFVFVSFYFYICAPTLTHPCLFAVSLANDPFSVVVEPLLDNGLWRDINKAYHAAFSSAFAKSVRGHVTEKPCHALYLGDFICVNSAVNCSCTPPLSTRRQATQGFDVLDLIPDDHFSRDCECALRRVHVCKYVVVSDTSMS